MSPLKEWNMWRQLKGAFEIDRFIFTPVKDYMSNVTIEQYPTMTEALEAAGEGDRVFLEPTGYNTVNDIPQGDIILILGNAGRHNMEHAHVNETYAIRTPKSVDLFGINAAAIALAARYGQ